MYIDYEIDPLSKNSSSFRVNIQNNEIIVEQKLLQSFIIKYRLDDMFQFISAQSLVSYHNLTTFVPLCSVVTTTL